MKFYLRFLFYFSIILLFQLQTSVAQDYDYVTEPEIVENKTAETSNIFVGGGFALAFGTVTNIEISPTLGYRLAERFYLGGGATYSYYNNSFYQTTAYYWGFNTYVRAELFRGIFVHAETDLLNVPDFFSTTANQRVWTEGFYVGAGLSQKAGQRAQVNLSVLWNLNENHYTIVQNPNIKIQYIFFLNRKQPTNDDF